MKAYNIIKKNNWKVELTTHSLVEDMQIKCDSPVVDMCTWEEDQMQWVIVDNKVCWIRVEGREFAEDIADWLNQTVKIFKKNHIDWNPYPTDYVTNEAWRRWREIDE